MITKEDWLPVGSMVRLKDGDRPVMVAGYMSIDGGSGRIWDYVGYPYPEGKTSRQDYFFDKDMIDEIVLVGYQNQGQLAFQALLESNDDAYQAKKAEAVQGASGDGTGAVSSSSTK